LSASRPGRFNPRKKGPLQILRENQEAQEQDTKDSGTLQL